MNKPEMKEEKKRNKDILDVVDYKLDPSLVDKYSGMTFFIKTYGCQMNEHDTEILSGLLSQMGLIEVRDYENSDIVILNTCSIRENANNKAYGMLGRLKHIKEENPNLIIGICGCMAQEENVVNEIIRRHKYVNFIIGTHNMHDLCNILDKSITSKNLEIEVLSKADKQVENMPVIRSNNFSAYVNIIYGCDKFCTYCIVPYTRGEQYSRKKEDILKEVDELVKDGYKEIILLGQNVNAYGKDLYKDYNLGNLLEDVAKKNIQRIRFLTSHPWDFTDNMIDIISKYKNIMPNIHLPVQSGSNKILKLMGRRYNIEEYKKLFDKLKNARENMTISTDIIVGFPQESEEDFKNTLDLVDYCKYDNAFTFIYSERSGTPACKLNDSVPMNIREERLQRLNEKVNKYFKENNDKLVGSTQKVLVYGKSTKENMYYGYSENYKLINFTSKNIINDGDIINVKITHSKTWSLDGEECE